MGSRTAEGLIMASAIFVGGLGVLSRGFGFSYQSAPLGGLAQTIITAVAAYSALGVRRILGVKLYRHQALGVGFMVIGLWVTNTSFALSSGPFANYPLLSSAVYGFGSAFLILLLLATFYWVDTSVKAAILADPLVRDPLRWHRVRFFLWPAIITSLILIILIILLVPSAFKTDPFLGILFPIAFLGVFLSGAIFIPTYARRAGDQTLRSNMKWFGLFLASILIFVLLIPFFVYMSSSLSTASQDAGFLAASYCLYRSARSLVPIYRFSEEEKALARNKPI